MYAPLPLLEVEGTGPLTASPFLPNPVHRWTTPPSRKLFSHTRMIELLIRGHIQEWDGKIEYSTLERLPGQWNAPTRLRDLFRDSAPDTYRVVERLPPGAPPPEPLDLPQMMLGLAGVASAADMWEQLPVLRRVVESCADEDFDRFMAQGVRAMLRSKGFDSDQLDDFLARVRGNG